VSTALDEVLKLFEHTESRNIAIGFDGDGAYGKKWPLPSDLTVQLCHNINTREPDSGCCTLIQAQVHNYAANADAYSQKHGDNPPIEVPFEDNVNFFTFVYFDSENPITNESIKPHFSGILPLNRGAFTKNKFGKEEYGGYNGRELVGSTAVWGHVIQNVLVKNVQVHLLTVWNDTLGDFDKSITGITSEAAELGLLGDVNMITLRTYNTVHVQNNHVHQGRKPHHRIWKEKTRDNTI
jgi:hypothetical protein